MPRWFHILLTCFILTGVPLPAPAQEEPTEEEETYTIRLVSDHDEGEIIDEFALLQEDAMVESAARHKQEIGMSPSAITVITREDIEASGANGFADLLRLVPGMEVVITSPSFSSVSTRLDWTFENKNFLVLIDGREANIELLGYTFFELQPVSIEDIERIEVIRGPGSSLYGANAFVGVISITTRAVPEETSAWMNVAGGEAGLTEVGARASTRMGPLGVSLSAGGIHMGNFTDPNRLGVEQWRVRSNLDYRLTDSRRLALDVGFADGKGPVATTAGTIHIHVPSVYLRTAYESESLKAQLFWNYFDLDGEIRVPLEFNRVMLAEFAPVTATGHTVDGEVQWTPPRIIDSLLIITGGGGRVSYVESENLLDGKTFADISSPDYHKPGITHWEGRVGAFVHLEFAPADWATVTGGLRFDYNNITGEFLSPRLAAVFRPTEGQFIRTGVARSFRKPTFYETNLHINVKFPDESPLTGTGQTEFQEFMTRVVGNRSISPDEIVSFETGYMGQFLDGRLILNLDLYCNINRGRITFEQDIVADETGLPDLGRSSFMFDNKDVNQYIFGGELTIRYHLSPQVAFLAWWSHRQVFQGSQDFSRGNPKNTLAAGGRLRTESGLVGSLYAFARSELWDITVENPAGILEPTLVLHMDNYVLLLSKVGWKIPAGPGIVLETGVKLFLPISFGSPHFRYRERGGGTSLTGQNYGGEELARMVTVYLQGSY
jgi:outer membrane receptor protein involved in Fe transport